MPIFVRDCVYIGASYEDKRHFYEGEPVPEEKELLESPILMSNTDCPIEVPPKPGTPDHAAAEQRKKLQVAEDAAHARRQAAKLADEQQAAVNRQKALAQAEALGLGNYQPGVLPGPQAPAARPAPQPLRQPLRPVQPGPRRAASS